MSRILWVDDEVDLLQPYIIYLKIVRNRAIFGHFLHIKRNLGYSISHMPRHRSDYISRNAQIIVFMKFIKK